MRQIKLLGVPALLEEVHQRHNPKLTNAFQIQQRNCEAETLRVFRLITAQVTMTLPFNIGTFLSISSI